MTLQQFVVPAPLPGHDWTWTVPGQYVATIVSIEAVLVPNQTPTVAGDASGNNRPLTYDTTGALTFGVNGPWGSAPNFAAQRHTDNTSAQEHGDFGNRPSDPAMTTTTTTIEGWVWWDTPPANQQLIFAISRTDGTPPLGERFRITVETGLGNALSFLNTAGRIMLEGNVTSGAWHHIAYTWDGATSTLYLDGAALAPTSATGPDTAANGNTFDIGGLRGALSAWYGRLAGVAYYNHAISAARIAAHFGANASAAAYKAAVLADTPLALWMFDDLATFFNRTANLVITDGTQQVAAFPAPTATSQGASFVWVWNADSGGNAQAAGQVVTTIQLPSLTLPPGYTIGTSTPDLTSGDQWSTIVVWADVTDSGVGGGPGTGDLNVLILG